LADSNGRRDAGHIPRPRNAFIIFRSSYAKTLMDSLSAGTDEQLPDPQQQPSNKRAIAQQRQGKISKFASMLWKTMSEKEREPFVQEAVLEKQAHRIRHPNYVYRPRRSLTRKARTRKANVTVPVPSDHRQEIEVGYCLLIYAVTIKVLSSPALSSLLSVIPSRIGRGSRSSS